MMTIISKLKALYPSQFDFKRIADTNLPDAEAQWDSLQNVLTMRESVFCAMQRGEPHARQTVAHEIGHFVLGHTGVRYRSDVKSTAEKIIPRIRHEESEARRFAPRLLAPASLIETSWTAEEIAERFGLSQRSAQIRVEEIGALYRRGSGETRRLPTVVVDFLREAKRRGATIRTDLDDPQS
jgi:Zn-dependent peptidase ImmA (M78 family)